MLRQFKGITVILIMVLTAVSSTHAIQRVAARWSLVEGYGGYSSPLGTYDNAGGVPFFDAQDNPVEMDAEVIYDPSYYFGFNYGQLRQGHLLMTLGFRYTKVKLDDQLKPLFTAGAPGLSMYDLEVNLNWQFMDLHYSSWSPYFGLGFHAGLVRQNYRDFNDEYNTTADLGLNFGAEVKLWSAPGSRSFVTLASINNWSFAASSERLRGLNIGGGLKYYFKM